jgi:hypothetical protein
MKTNLVRP